MRTVNVACAASMAVLLAACGQLPEFMTPKEEAPAETPAPPPAPMQLKPLQVVQRIGKFGFCSECPAVTQKRVFLAINANSDDAAERAMARLRDALEKRAPGAKTGEGALIERVGATSGKAKEPWIIFALIGDPSDAAMQKALSTVVAEFKGSSFHLLAEPSQDAQLAAFQGLLRKSGVPDAMMTAAIIQAEHRVDAAVAAPGTKDLATLGRPKMLVIRN